MPGVPGTGNENVCAYDGGAEPLVIYPGDLLGQVTDLVCGQQAGNPQYVNLASQSVGLILVDVTTDQANVYATRAANLVQRVLGAPLQHVPY